MSAPWDELIAFGKQKGFVTYADIDRAMPKSVKGAQIDKWVAALYEHGIDVRDEPEPIRTYDDERVHSARRTGRAIGPLFVQNLLDLAAGELPISYPCGGVYCVRGEAAYSAVHFPDGLTFGVGRWLASPDRGDAALITFVDHERAVTLKLGSCDGTMKYDLECWFKVAVTDGRIETSLPRCELQRVGPDVGDAFMDGLRAGMTEHKNAGKLGFGTLGEYPKV